MRGNELERLGYTDDWCAEIDYVPEPVHDAEGALVGFDFVDRRIRVVDSLGGASERLSRMYDEAVATNLSVEEIVSRHASSEQQHRFSRLHADGLI